MGDTVDRWREDIKEYTKRGLKCSMWKHDAKDMDRDELLAFIGFLDEQFTEFQKRTHPRD